MPDTPTPLDLDAIRADLDARVPARDLGDRNHARGLLAEVERLRAEVAVARQHQREAALTIRSVEGLRKERDDALAEVARLATRPAPAWGEDAIRAARDEYVRHNLGMAVVTYGDRLRCAFEAGVDAVREHLPVKPDREALAQKAFEAAGRDDWGAANDLERDEWLAVADAMLDLWPGRPETEVTAEAWDEGFVAGVNADMGDYEHPPEIVINPYREGGAS